MLFLQGFGSSNSLLWVLLKVPERHHLRGTTLPKALRRTCFSEASVEVSERQASAGLYGEDRKRGFGRGNFLFCLFIFLWLLLGHENRNNKNQNGESWGGVACSALLIRRCWDTSLITESIGFEFCKRRGMGTRPPNLSEPQTSSLWEPRNLALGALKRFRGRSYSLDLEASRHS